MEMKRRAPERHHAVRLLDPVITTSTLHPFQFPKHEEIGGESLPVRDEMPLTCEQLRESARSFRESERNNRRRRHIRFVPLTFHGWPALCRTRFSAAF
jgi:hypothetical protein